ncbi:MAG: bifunctional adenosylcobinamide kinase/adenosylcobinamide-phosphate guanylyltransferase [Ezakiella sp.]|uniref:bifunctional adenosylcobinamide kinase/adenosylcobinamide-phosphate guanylyltransferase n=1 Tax=Ezakiella sp. TaxID=1935205 RepID=UPI002977E2E8|nr:bifunctional adenosylcobinamide kinase/adenosylcobinamide-phosphate guanylyltransferase [Ezakiella sp.]MDD7731897.1 bifunctional adenosylcobinamide kinase/adenosylcobinamide-phosphate guanylyltransferase [Eubacteriales bacterium]MDY6080220.1 bifunctional adenosylcobinamide kinase/adenosylcobinamide-phosphate guanylyltransferase [Ezakiella sp.]
MISIVTGGARSGKSEFAESLIKGDAIYIATAENFDDEMDLRIKKHVKRREESSINWRTVECLKKFDGLSGDEKYVLFDSLGVFISNIMFSKTADDLSDESIEETILEVRKELEHLLDWARENDKELVIVTDEVGMSIIPESKVARVYRDLIGTINKEVAAKCDRAYLVCMGIEVRLK